MKQILMAMLIMASMAFAADVPITSPVVPGDPTSPLYGVGLMFDGFHEQIIGLIRGPDAEFALQVKHHQSRIAEVAAMAYRGDAEAMEKAKQAMATMEAKMRVSAQRGEVSQQKLQMFNDALETRALVLTELLDTVPEQARIGIQAALDAPKPVFSQGEIGAVPDLPVNPHLQEAMRGASEPQTVDWIIDAGSRASIRSPYPIPSPPGNEVQPVATPSISTQGITPGAQRMDGSPGTGGAWP